MIFYDEIAEDVLDCALDRGIVDLVSILHSKGIVTEMSCDGHGKHNAWIMLSSAFFKNYIKKNKKKITQFLLIGETRWKLQINYFGVSRFRGLGQIKPRLKKLKRVVQSEMNVIIVLDGPSMNGKKKTKNMIALEKAAKEML